MSAEETVLAVEGLTIATPGGKVLLENASFTMGRAQIVLLVGPSGSGKSTIINVLSGLIEGDLPPWRLAGKVWCAGHEFDLGAESCDVGGLVFQNHALFDDLTTGENLGIAADHAQVHDAGVLPHAARLLQDIAPDKVVAACSGGQKQRVAIARTLMANRPLILFDEPNSGLDKRSSLELAALIHDLCQRMGKPALIVAHHIDDLLPIADKVLLLDPRTRSLRELPPGVDLQQVLRELQAPPERTEEAANVTEIWAGLRPRPRQRWITRYFAEYFWELCVSPLLLLYVAFGAAIVGFVTVWFGLNYETLGEHMRSLVHDQALAGIGFIQVTVAVPLVTCLLVVARNNAIIAADIGNRMLSSQFRAMRNLHIPGRRYLVWSIVVNMLVGTLLLVLIAVTMSSLASFHTWRVLFPGQPFELWQEHFFRVVWRTPEALAINVAWVVVKVELSMALASLIAIGVGALKKTSVLTINYGIAQAIVLGVSVTLLVHAGVAVLQY